MQVLYMYIYIWLYLCITKSNHFNWMDSSLRYVIDCSERNEFMFFVEKILIVIIINYTFQIGLKSNRIDLFYIHLKSVLTIQICLIYKKKICLIHFLRTKNRMMIFINLQLSHRTFPPFCFLFFQFLRMSEANEVPISSHT